jgi:RimJ/RimL family protein N-acetyltransferase
MTVDDTDLILKWRSNPRVLSGNFNDRCPTREQHLKWFASLGTSRREFIVLGLPDRRPIGTAGLSGIDHDNGRAELGVMIGEDDCVGRGYASDATRLLVRMAFTTMKLRRLYLMALRGNESALHLYRKLGFKEEGILREHVMKSGRPQDVVYMGLLRSEWTDGE